MTQYNIKGISIMKVLDKQIKGNSSNSVCVWWLVYHRGNTKALSGKAVFRFTVSAHIVTETITATYVL